MKESKALLRRNAQKAFEELCRTAAMPIFEPTAEDKDVPAKSWHLEHNHIYGYTIVEMEGRTNSSYPFGMLPMKAADLIAAAHVAKSIRPYIRQQEQYITF